MRRGNISIVLEGAQTARAAIRSQPMYNVAKLPSRRRRHTSIRCLNKPISKMTMLKHLRKIIGDETLTVRSFVSRCRLGLIVEHCLHHITGDDASL